MSLQSDVARARIVHKSAGCGAELQETVGQHQQVPVPNN